MPEPGEGDTLGVERLRNRPRSFEPDLLARIGRISLSIADRLVRPLHRPRMIAHAKGEAAAFL